MIRILLLSHLRDRRIVRFNIDLSLEPVDNDRLAFIILLKRLAKPYDRRDPLGARKHRRMGIDRPVSCDKTQYLRLIKLYCLTGIELPGRQDKRLVHQHLIFKTSGQDPQDTGRHILNVRVMPLHIILIIHDRRRNKFLCRRLDRIFRIQLMLHYNIRDLIHQVMILQDHLLHLEDRRVGFSYFF